MIIASVRTTLYSAMAMSTCNLLLLLVPVLSLCGATEYYVRPTEPSSTPCPGHPCRTLSGYIRYSFYYFQSDTTFKFLPGTHYMDKPLIIAGKNNISLESYSDERPQLVAEFPCECGSSNYRYIPCIFFEAIKVSCTAIQLRDMNHVTLKGINVTVQAPGLSGLLLVNVSNSTVQDISSRYLLHYPEPVGIIINNSQSIVLQSLSVFNFQYGIVFGNTTHINISKIRTIGNKITGLSLLTSRIITITETTSSHNGRHGIKLCVSSGVHIIDSVVSHNKRSGIYLLLSNFNRILSTRIENNGGGIYTYTSFQAIFANTIIKDNAGNGLQIEFSFRNNVINTTAIGNRVGLLFKGSSGNNISHTTVVQNRKEGLCLYDANRNNIVNTTAIRNMAAGIQLHDSVQNYISYTTTMLNERGLSLLLARWNTFTNTIAIKNTREGIFLDSTYGNYFNSTITTCNKNGQICSKLTSSDTFTDTIEICNGGIEIC